MKQSFDNLNLLETFQHGVFVFDPDLKLISHNQVGVRMMDMPEELMVSGTSIEAHFLFNAERGEYGDGDIAALVEQRMEPLRDHKPFDYQIERPNGKVIWRHGMFNEDGWLVVTFTDVTIRAREEDFLRHQNKSLSKLTQTQKVEIEEASENLERQNHILDTILSNISDGVSLVGRDLKLKMANNQLFDLLDLPQDLNQEGLSVRKVYELLSQLGELGPNDAENDVDNFIAELFSQKESVLERDLKSGRSIKVSRKLVEDGIVTTIADVTDLRTSQKQLEATNQAIGERIEHQEVELSAQRKLADRLHAAIDASDTSILLFDDQYRFVFANKRFRDVNPEGAEHAFLGMTYENFLLRNLRLGVYPEIKEPYEDYVASRKAHLQHHSSNTIIAKTKFGTWLQIHEHRLPDGSLLSMASDITKLREVQIELEANEQRFRDFAADGADWFWEMDETLTFSYVNGKIDEVLGLKAEEMIGKSRHEVHGYSPITAQGTWNSYLDTVEDEIHFVSPPVTIVRPNGETRYIITSGKPIYTDTGEFRGYRGVGRDITDLTRTEEALRRSQKMEAVGQLSGGIAHDFNNILGIIFGNLELLAEGLSEGSSEKKFADNALKGAARAAELTHKLLGFSRHHHGSIDHTDVNKLVHNMSQLISKSLTGSISVELNLQEDLLPVAINVGDFEDTLLNLSLNAKDAMPDGGKLFIETTNVVVGASDLKDYPEAKIGKYVVLTVQDTGAGMSMDVRERMFEPFFTTKDVGKGTGLGLSMVFGFVRRSGGFIELHSEPAMGTTFKIFLPEDTSGKKTTEAAQAEKPKGKGQGERILLVDDEEDLLQVTKQVLEANGYSVVMTQNTREALSQLTSSDKYDLLFSDVILAEDMDGFALAKKAKEIDPKINILLTSGYSEKHNGDQVNAEQDNADKSDMILKKPYTQTELISAIREVLEN